VSYWVVIPAFDQVAQTERCVNALLEGHAVDAILVVDHGPEEQVSKALAPYPDVQVLREGPDLWWTGATNAGIRHALGQGATMVMLLNCDCIIDPASVDSLLESALATRGVVAPLQRDLASGEVTVSRAGTAVWLGLPTTYASRAVPDSALAKTQMIVGGRGVVIPREVFETVGLLAEHDLPHYGADHDFYLRCRRAGIPLMIQSSATVFVDSGTTSLANRTGDLSFAELRESLTNQRSHRNIRALAALFRRNYPVKPLWWIGLVLAVARYVLVWTVKRPITLLAIAPRSLRTRPRASAKDPDPKQGGRPE
jgi:GT2 family glycosyltransferase